MKPLSDFIHRTPWWGLILGGDEKTCGRIDARVEQKAVDFIGLYLHPPAHAGVFCVEEKPAIQALDRKDPVLPLPP